MQSPCWRLRCSSSMLPLPRAQVRTLTAMSLRAYCLLQVMHRRKRGQAGEMRLPVLTRRMFPQMAFLPAAERHALWPWCQARSLPWAGPKACRRNRRRPFPC